jgi:hypothetical protein
VNKAREQLLSPPFWPVPGLCEKRDKPFTTPVRGREKSEISEISPPLYAPTDYTGHGEIGHVFPFPPPRPSPTRGREPSFSLPHKGGGSLVSPSPLVGEGRGGGGGEGALFLPPPLWGRVGVGGNCAQFNRAQYKLVGGIAR